MGFRCQSLETAARLVGACGGNVLLERLQVKRMFHLRRARPEVRFQVLIESRRWRAEILC